jgi:hypothetical protein
MWPGNRPQQGSRPTRPITQPNTQTNHFTCKLELFKPQLNHGSSKALEVRLWAWKIYSSYKKRLTCWYWTFNLICCFNLWYIIFNSAWSPTRYTIHFGGSPPPTAPDRPGGEINCPLLQYLRWLWPSSQYVNFKGICKILVTSLQM